ncbi:MAG: hypothetical protein FJW30_01200 [Acidobacteria bacterium]|nr:hypothetical protein [Acidobacteriota bacterium]
MEAREATEPLGKVAGREIAATYFFSSGVHDYFATRSNDATTGDRFGITLLGSKGALCLPTTTVPGEAPLVLQGRSWAAGSWQSMPEGSQDPATSRPAANHMIVADLLDAVTKNRAPARSHIDGGRAIETALAPYQSERKGRVRTALPLLGRDHPLTTGL